MSRMHGVAEIMKRSGCSWSEANRRLAAEIPADKPPAASLDKLLAEVVRLLNEHEHEAAMREFRRYFGLVNVWQCDQCGRESSGHQILKGCPKCGGEMSTRVVRQVALQAVFLASAVHSDQLEKVSSKYLQPRDGEPLKLGAMAAEFAEAEEQQVARQAERQADRRSGWWTVVGIRHGALVRADSAAEAVEKAIAAHVIGDWEIMDGSAQFLGETLPEVVQY